MRKFHTQMTFFGVKIITKVMTPTEVHFIVIKSTVLICQSFVT